MLPKRSKKKFKFCNREIRYFLGKQVASRILQCYMTVARSRYDSPFLVFMSRLVPWFSVIDRGSKI